MIEDYVPNDPRDFDEWHEPRTISYGELLEWGFIDWSDPTWHWDAYSEEQFQRVTHMIDEHFYDRDIALLPPGLWKRELIRTLNEAMPKYKPMYKALDDGADLLAISDKYGKSRNIYSDYPDTMLSGNSDYASTGSDTQYEHIERGDLAEKMMQLHRDFLTVDQMILEDVEPLFSVFFSVSIGGY